MTGPRLSRPPRLQGSKPHREGISSDTFSASQLRDSAVESSVREYRGSAKLAPEWRGQIAAQLWGGRIVR